MAWCLGPWGFPGSAGSSIHVGRARHRGEAMSSPLHLSPIRHGALHREVGSPELWWWTRAGGSGPTLAWGPMLWGGDMKKAWGLGTVVANVSIGQPATLGLCWPKPVTSELVSKIATCRWGPHTLSLPPQPCSCSRPAGNTHGLRALACYVPSAWYFVRRWQLVPLALLVLAQTWTQ